MTGAAYADLVAFYVSRRFEDRGLKVYREIQIGKTIIGKNRHVDILCVCERTNRAFAIECKFQESIGTVDEKIPYALDDLNALPMAGCIAYAGRGFSDGVLHMLEASPHAAYCMPGDRSRRAERRDARARSPDGDALRVVGRAHRQQTSSFRSAPPAFLNRFSGSRQTAII